jgi:SM-20-related protein
VSDARVQPALDRPGSLAQSAVFEQIGGDIAEHGIAVSNAFLPATLVAALAGDLRRRDAAGAFRAAGIGRGAARGQNVAMRGDRILWLDTDDAEPAACAATAALDALRAELNAMLFLGLVSFEAHYAIYPPGAGYRRHRDRFFDDDTRVLSCVLYLNADWTAEQGGALRIYRDDEIERDILPIGGTLVCFRSERFDHEVLPSTRERLSLTGWFKRRGTQTA